MMLVACQAPRSLLPADCNKDSGVDVVREPIPNQPIEFCIAAQGRLAIRLVKVVPARLPDDAPRPPRRVDRR